MFSTRVRLAGAAALALLLLGAPAVAFADSHPVVGGAALGKRGVVVSGAKPPDIAATSWVIADADTGDILAAKNAHRRLRPASTLKTLTSVTLLPLLDKDQKYKVKYNDAAVVGSAVGIVPGATYTIDQLFYGMLLPSGNDAAHALANVAGGVHKTVDLMSAEASHLDALDTTVQNPSGLDAPHQFTSAYDLALFARAGLQRRDFCRYVSTVTTAFPAEMPKHGKKRKTYQIYNQNPLLFNGYRGAIGVKTGYTTLAGRTFVGAAKRGGQTLIVTMMGIRTDTEAAAEQLLNWGFTQGGRVQPVGGLVAPIGTAHTVRIQAASATIPATSAPQSSGSSIGWRLLVMVALALLVTWWTLVRLRRRPRRPALPRW